MKRNGNAKRFGLVWVFALVCGVVLMCCQETMAEEPADELGTDSNPPAADGKTPAADGKAPATAEEFFQLGEKYADAARDTNDEKKSKENWSKAAECWRKAAELGSPDAMIALGEYYDEGDEGRVKRGIKANFTEALKWYRKAEESWRKAAEQGDAKAQFALGKYYMSPVFGKKNPDEAIKWYLKAAEQGNVDAQMALGEYHESFWNASLVASGSLAVEPIIASTLLLYSS